MPRGHVFPRGVFMCIWATRRRCVFVVELARQRPPPTSFFTFFSSTTPFFLLRVVTTSSRYPWPMQLSPSRPPHLHLHSLPDNPSVDHAPQTQAQPSSSSSSSPPPPPPSPTPLLLSFLLPLIVHPVDRLVLFLLQGRLRLPLWRFTLVPIDLPSLSASVFACSHRAKHHLHALQDNSLSVLPVYSLPHSIIPFAGPQTLNSKRRFSYVKTPLLTHYTV
jgi:hypothetical protein